MRFTLVLIGLVALAGCSKQPERSAATANADAIADQLEAKANNYSMMADDTANSDAALALENASETLDEQSANLRAAASPNEAVK